MTDLIAGARFGGCRILGVLGRGGMGVVYRAVRDGDERPVALKVIAPDVAHDPRFRARFEREARLAATVRHEGVAAVLDQGEDGGLLYLVAELVEGTSLEARLRAEGPWPWSRVARTGAELARALEAVHAAGLIHRDVKPANVLAGADGRVKLTDFGLARRATPSDTTALTETGEVVGTLEYLAPELAGPPEGVGPAADLYALGATLFALVAGRPPFGGRGAALILQHARATPEPLRRLVPDVPQALEVLVLALLAKDPAQRPATAGAVAAELERIAGAGPRRSPARWAIAAALVVVTAAVVRGARPGETEPGSSAPGPRPTPSPVTAPAATPSATAVARELDSALEALLARQLDKAEAAIVRARTASHGAPLPRAHVEPVVRAALELADRPLELGTGAPTPARAAAEITRRRRPFRIALDLDPAARPPGALVTAAQTLIVPPWRDADFDDSVLVAAVDAAETLWDARAPGAKATEVAEAIHRATKDGSALSKAEAARRLDALIARLSPGRERIEVFHAGTRVDLLPADKARWIAAARAAEPQDPDLLLDEEDWLRGTPREPEGRALVERALALDSGHPRARLHRSDWTLRSEVASVASLQAALDDVVAYLEKEPNVDHALFLRALALARLDRASEAYDAHRQSKDLGKLRADQRAVQLFARLRVQRGELEAAAEFLTANAQARRARVPWESEACERAASAVKAVLAERDPDERRRRLDRLLATELKLPTW